jgi:hypothetical protein
MTPIYDADDEAIAAWLKQQNESTINSFSLTKKHLKQPYIKKQHNGSINQSRRI